MSEEIKILPDKMLEKYSLCIASCDTIVKQKLFMSEELHISPDKC